MGKSLLSEAPAAPFADAALGCAAPETPYEGPGIRQGGIQQITPPSVAAGIVPASRFPLARNVVGVMPMSFLRPNARIESSGGWQAAGGAGGARPSSIHARHAFSGAGAQRIARALSRESGPST